MIKIQQEEEVPDPHQDYSIPMTPRTSPRPKVRSRNTSPGGFVNNNNYNYGNGSQGIPTSGKFNSTIPILNRMDINDIQLSIFNGNGLEDPERNWFLCKVVWIV